MTSRVRSGTSPTAVLILVPIGSLRAGKGTCIAVDQLSTDEPLGSLPTKSNGSSSLAAWASEVGTTPV